MIQELEKEFIGKGEVSESKFIQIFDSVHGYIYEVKQLDVHTPLFEVFKRKNTPICIDFENRVYSDTEFKEIYPKSKDFGVWAWTCNNIEDAKLKFDSLNKL